MKNSQHEPRIRAYLRKELSVSERAQFEAQLKTDVDFQKAYLTFCLQSEGSKELFMEDRYREMAESVKAEIGPIPEPRLTWWDHIRFAMYRPLYHRLASVAALAFGGVMTLMIWANAGGVDPTSEVFPRYLMLTPCNIKDQEVAGKNAFDRLADITAMLERSKQFYCDGALDSLQLNQDTFGVADYYVAQLQLKARDWTGAQQSLEKCLSNKDVLQQFSNNFDLAEIRFNLLLARLGNSGKYGPERSDLVKLLEDKTTGKMVKDKIKAFRAEMESPLRWFYFR